MRLSFRVSAAFAIGLAAMSPAAAANYAIDPDPRSPTLGEMLDRERAARMPVPRAVPSVIPPVVPSAVPVERVVSSEPRIPAGAVTVLAPGVRRRVAPKAR